MCQKHTFSSLRGWLTLACTVCWWPTCLGNIFAPFIPLQWFLINPLPCLPMHPSSPGSLWPKLLSWAYLEQQLCFAHDSLPTHLLLDHGNPSKGREEVCLHLVLTSPLCYKCEWGCRFRPAVKVALGYGYISTRKWCKVANSFTKTRKELKSCWMLKASSQY